jgi:hypothetical protein
MNHALSQLQGGDGLYLYGGDYGYVSWGRNGGVDSWTQSPIEEVYSDWVTVVAVSGESPVFSHLSMGTWDDGSGSATPLSFSEVIRPGRLQRMLTVFRFTT